MSPGPAFDEDHNHEDDDENDRKSRCPNQNREVIVRILNMNNAHEPAKDNINHPDLKPFIPIDSHKGQRKHGGNPFTEELICLDLFLIGVFIGHLVVVLFQCCSLMQKINIRDENNFYLPVPFHQH